MKKVHKVKAPKFLYSDEYCDSDNIEAVYLEKFEEIDFDECWYWYLEGCYCGVGHILFRSGYEYRLYEINHCSCYGPIENINNELDDYENIPELFDSISDDLFDQLRCLFDAAGISLP